MLECLYVHLPVFTRSPHVEVQERAVAYHEFVVWLVEQAHMQPFISVPVERRTRWNDNKADAASDKAAKKDATPAAPLTDLLDDRSTASALSPRHLNGSLPPASLLSSLAVQVNLLFSERLNPVNPKAQRKVPVPKGLDLDAVLNPGWDVDSDKSDDPVTESDDDDGDSSKKRKRKDRKRDKEKKKKKDRNSGGAGLFDEEDYSKPLTEAEKAEAKRRLEARRAAQAADPFYVKDRPSTSSSLLASPTGDAAVQRLTASDLPPLHVEGEKGHKKKSKRRGKGGDEDSDDGDDIFAGVGQKGQAKVFKVKKVDDMPSGAESSDDDGDDDLNAPLGDDEVIPTVKPYGSDDKEKKKKKKKEGRDDEDRKKERKKKDKDREKEKERKKEKSGRSKESSAVDDFDPMSKGKGKAEEESEEEDRDDKKKKKKKEREKENEDRDRDRDREKEKKRKDKSGDKDRGDDEDKERDRERKKDKKRKA